MIYTSSNTALQAIDTFDPPTVSSIRYSMEISTNTDVADVTLTVTHDGINTSEIQYGSSLSNTTPLVLTTDIVGNTGYVYAQPTSNVTTFKIDRTDVATQVYADNINSGQAIPGNTGFGIVFGESSTVRQADNNQYSRGNHFYGESVEQLPNLLGDWSSWNNSDLSSVGNTYTISSSSFNDNYQYQEIPVTKGKVYKISVTCYYEVPTDINAIIDNQISVGIPAVKVGTTQGNGGLFNYQATTSSATITGIFAPDSDSIWVTAGYGQLNSRLIISDIYVVEVGPFNTYDQDQGTVYVKWSALPINSKILTFTATDSTTQTVSISSDNTVIITCNSIVVNSGMQSATNKLLFTYSSDGMTASLNGGLVANASAVPLRKVYKIDFNNVPTEFSYVPELLSNTSIVEIST